MTETARFTTRLQTVDVTSTVTNVVQETEVVTRTVTDTATATGADQAEETPNNDDPAGGNNEDPAGGIADVNTNVATVTDFETSTFVVTTTVDPAPVCSDTLPKLMLLTVY